MYLSLYGSNPYKLWYKSFQPDLRRVDTSAEEVTYFHFASLFNEGKLIKEKNCSCRSKFFFVRVDPIGKGSKQEVTKVPLPKIAEK